jgi:hypothetical protein
MVLPENERVEDMREREMREEEEGRRLGIVRGEMRETVFFLRL